MTQQLPGYLGPLTRRELDDLRARSLAQRRQGVLSALGGPCGGRDTATSGYVSGTAYFFPCPRLEHWLKLVEARIFVHTARAGSIVHAMLYRRTGRPDMLLAVPGTAAIFDSSVANVVARPANADLAPGDYWAGSMVIHTGVSPTVGALWSDCASVAPYLRTGLTVLPTDFPRAALTKSPGTFYTPLISYVSQDIADVL